MRFDNQVAVVTGAGQGMGRSHAEAFAAGGASVVVVDRNAAAAQAVAASLASAIAVVADVSNSADTTRMADEALAAFGRIDIVVNNAGGGLFPKQSLLELPEDRFDLIVDVNLKGQWLCSRAVVPSMRAIGAGKIINITSVSALYGGAGRSAYAASKGGVIGLTRVLARELGSDNINVNAIAPGLIQIRDPKTAFSPEQFEAMKESNLARQQIKRLGQPADVTPAVLFLASSDASFITGQVLVIDGGATLGAAP